jgi:hypothetical protein
MNALADNTTRALEIEDYLERTRRSILRYAYDHDEAAAKENSETECRAIANISYAAKPTLSK